MMMKSPSMAILWRLKACSVWTARTPRRSRASTITLQAVPTSATSHKSCYNIPRETLRRGPRNRKCPLLSSIYSGATNTHTVPTHPVQRKYGLVTGDWWKRRARKRHPYTDHETHNYPLHISTKTRPMLDSADDTTQIRKEHHTCHGKSECPHGPLPRAHIRGKGWREIFKRHVFRVYLIDEYRSSITCPECSSHLESFKRVPTQRPWQRAKRPEVHGRDYGIVSIGTKTRWLCPTSGTFS